jgi:aquaporin related protein
MILNSANISIGAGPFLGTAIAVFFYKFIKMLEYEMANPGQDGDDKNDPTKNHAKRAAVKEGRD